MSIFAAARQTCGARQSSPLRMADEVSDDALVDQETPCGSCSICCDDMTSSSTTHVLECGHRFHTKCIVDWFRQAHTCPLCRDAFHHIDGLTLRSRAAYLRTHARRAQAPRELKRMVARLRKCEDERTATRRAMRDHRRQHLAVYRGGDALSRRFMNLHMKHHRLIRILGAASFDHYPLPPLIVR